MGERSGGPPSRAGTAGRRAGRGSDRERMDGRSIGAFGPQARRWSAADRSSGRPDSKNWTAPSRRRRAEQGLGAALTQRDQERPLRCDRSEVRQARAALVPQACPGAGMRQARPTGTTPRTRRPGQHPGHGGASRLGDADRFPAPGTAPCRGQSRPIFRSRNRAPQFSQMLDASTGRMLGTWAGSGARRQSMGPTSARSRPAPAVRATLAAFTPRATPGAPGGPSKG